MARFLDFLKLPSDKIKYLSNKQSWDMGFIPHLGFIYPTQLRIVGYNHLGVSQGLHGLAPKCKLINMHELINKSTNDYVTLLPCENGVNVNNKG